MRDIIKIVLTGGSNSGKTELIERIKENYRSDFTVGIVPESATELLNEGVKPNRNFQEKISCRQFINEAIIGKRTKNKDKKGNVILLYDRSFMDQLAYCSKEDWQKYMKDALDTSSFDESIEVLNDRYDVVIHLESNARFTHIAEGRLETQEEAIELEKKTLSANQYFDNLYYVERQDNIDDKYNEVIDIIDYELKVRGMK